MKKLSQWIFVLPCLWHVNTSMLDIPTRDTVSQTGRARYSDNPL